MGKYALNKYQSKNASISWVILLVLLLLALTGLFVLRTINVSLFWQQALFLVVGIAIMFLLSKLDSVVLWWFAPYGYVISLLLIVASYIGPSIRGASRWIQIGPMQLQPSEIVKPLLLLAFARAMTTYSPRNLRWFLLHIALFIVPFLLVFKQPDLGTSLVYGSMWLSMAIAGGVSLVLLVFGVVGFGLGFPFLWEHLAPFQKARITTFLNPTLDPTGAGYNALQAMIAVGSGQLFGLGLGRGTQSHLRFLPEYHTDFIFATLIEELGFVGGLGLLFLYALLLWQLIVRFLRKTSDDAFTYLYTIGLFAMLLSQVVINTGMNMGIIPVTGITLPLVSYGGSSLLSLAMAFGMYIALSRSHPVD